MIKAIMKDFDQFEQVECLYTPFLLMNVILIILTLYYNVLYD